jgi:hypothetical protein
MKLTAAESRSLTQVLRENSRLAASLASYQAARVADVDEKNWLRDRVTVLEAIIAHLNLHTVCAECVSHAAGLKTTAPETHEHVWVVEEQRGDATIRRSSSETSDPSKRTGPYTGDYDDLAGDRTTSETRDEHVHMWSGTAPDAFCVGCHAERYPTENPPDA